MSFKIIRIVVIIILYIFKVIYVLKTKLPDNKPIFISLLSVYGIGLNRSIRLCKQLGFLSPLKVKDMFYEQIKQLSDLMVDLSFKIPITNELKKLVKKKEKILSQIASYRGIRLKKGLPVRGQRTHSNAKTASRFVSRYQEQQKVTQKKRYKKKLKKKK